MKPRFALALIALSALAGCAALNNAGTAEYSIKPFTDGTGAIACGEIKVVNGKEIARLEAHISKQGDNYTVDLIEQGVKALPGQAIAADAVRGLNPLAVSP